MYSREEIIDELRKVAAKLGVSHLKQQDFILNSTIPINTVKYHLGTWVQAVKAAGLEPPRDFAGSENPELVQDDELLRELVRLHHVGGKPPTVEIIKAHGAFSLEYYTSRWQTLERAMWKAREMFPEAFREDTPRPPDRDLFPEADTSPIRLIPQTIKPKRTERTERQLGEPMRFRGLRSSPVDRDGVLFLFGMLAVELGFELEFVSRERPHAEGRRYFDLQREQWKHQRVEFFFKSSEYTPDQDSGREPCDLLVCWEHDCEDCPVEVLELKRIVRDFGE
ncbi:MAG: hypothetical protein RB296_10305 [Acidobacteriota bacterium]|jgi:hypothetical protein|nr:hypothetical protein [Acidobacteriota bacterium]